MGKKRDGKIIMSRPIKWEFISNLKQSEDEIITLAKAKIKNDPSVISIIPGKIPGVGSEPVYKLDVVYTYEWLDAIPVSERNTANHPSREFCIEMMDLSASGQTWTRAEIESLENEIGTSVWDMRGGWWTREGTDVHLPYCRHIWNQKVVIS